MFTNITFGIAHNFWWCVERHRTQLTLERVDVIINGAGIKRSDDQEDATSLYFITAAAFLGATNAIVVEVVAAYSAKVTAHRAKIIVGVVETEERGMEL